jgi:outer membrane receptor for ferrienterochelin and colicin
MKNYILAVFLALICHFSIAQSSMEIRTVSGNNEPVPFIGVKVANPAIGYTRTVQTDEQGKARLDGLSTAGIYIVANELSSIYAPSVVLDISLVNGKTTTVVLRVDPKDQVLGAVEVKASRSINTTSAEVASEMDRKDLQSIPIEGRDITRALYRLPNITQATGFFPEAPNVAVNGANSLYTNYTIDGMDNNENFLGGQRFNIPLGFTRNITALTNNFSAEFGLTANGVINITSRSGSNEREGEVFYSTRPGPVIDATSPYAQRDLSGNQVKDGFQRQQLGFAYGAPILKDKTFYFLNAEKTIDIKDNLLRVPELNINEAVRGRNNFSYLSGRIDHNWTQRFRSALRIHAGIVNIERQGGGLEGGVSFPSAANAQDRNSFTAAMHNSYFGESWTGETNLQYGTFHWNYANPENANSPNVTVEGPEGQPLALLGHPGYIFNEKEATAQLQQKFTFYKKNHTIKTGFQIRTSAFELFGGGNPNGSWRVSLNQSQIDNLIAGGYGSNLMPIDLPADVEVLDYSVELRPNSFEANQNIYSVFVEDRISMSPRLNLSVGIRYDYDNLSEGASGKGDMNNIAPRISANYNINEKTSVRLGYGMYFDKILYAIYSDARQFSSDNEDFKKQIHALSRLGLLADGINVNDVVSEGNLSASSSGLEYLQSPFVSELQAQRESVFSNERRILNPNGYQNPFSHQFMAGIQRKVSGDVSYYVDVMHNRSYNLFRLRDLNAPEAYYIDPDAPEVRTQAEADLSRPVPIYTDNSGSYSIVDGDTLRGVARNIVMTETAGRSNYYALNFTFNKDRGEDDYSLRMIYTLSYLENNTEDINFRAMDSNNFENEWGPSINDRTHVFNTFFTWYPFRHFSATMAALIQSGQPINRVPDASVFGTSDLNGDGRSFGDAYVGNSDRHPGEERNGDRLPWSNSFDLAVEYTIPTGEGAQFLLGAQVFNLLNAENLSGYSNNATQSNQIQTGSAESGLLIRRNAAPPRQFQFSARWTF